MAVQTFTGDIVRFSNRIDADFSTVIKRLSFGILLGVVLKTPVDVGRARGGWTVGVNASPAFVEGRINTSQAPSPEETAKLSILDSNPYSIVLIANNLPYILFLENGSSKQAPQGMAAITIEEERQAFQAA